MDRQSDPMVMGVDMLTIEVKPMAHCALVRVAGDADHDTAPELEQRLLAEIEAGNRNLVINGRELAYISSAGLRALMSAQLRARRSEPRGKIVFSELSPRTEKTFQMVGFHELFELYPADAAAAASFQ